MNDLIERLRAVKWEVTDDCGRMPDDPTQKCVFVDMRPDEFEALLRETAAALEAAREDAAEAKQNGYELGLLAGAQEAERLRGVIARYERKLDAAIDQARGEGGQEVES